MDNQIRLKLQAELEEIHRLTADQHPNRQDGHAYIDNPFKSGTCWVCGWANKDGPRKACGHTEREHLERDGRIIEHMLADNEEGLREEMKRAFLEFLEAMHSASDKRTDTGPNPQHGYKLVGEFLLHPDGRLEPVGKESEQFESLIRAIFGSMVNAEMPHGNEDRGSYDPDLDVNRELWENTMSRYPDEDQ